MLPLSRSLGPMGRAWGGGAFSPTDIAGLAVWLKADALALSDGAPVSTWAGSSGNGHTGTNTTTAPTFHTNVKNGLGAVQFAGNTGIDIAGMGDAIGHYDCNG